MFLKDPLEILMCSQGCKSKVPTFHILTSDQSVLLLQLTRTVATAKAMGRGRAVVRPRSCLPAPSSHNNLRNDPQPQVGQALGWLMGDRREGLWFNRSPLYRVPISRQGRGI